MSYLYQKVIDKEIFFSNNKHQEADQRGDNFGKSNNFTMHM